MIYKNIITATCFKVLLLTIIICGATSCKKQQNNDKTDSELIVFHAGSLSLPFKEIALAFEQENPGIEIKLESAGSRTCARKISDLTRPCDIMASADYSVINTLLIPEYADWNIRFATNEMTIVFHDSSPYSEIVNSQNWYEILMKKDVAFGRSNPDVDPCGYRAVFTMKLAENYYKKPGLAEKMLKKNTNCIRPKETDLIALLEVGEIDYLFLYRSVAQQHNLKYITLPDEINLKKPEFANIYQTASLEISGKKPGTTVTKLGQPMVYGVTIPKNAPNPKSALAFINFLLAKDKGMAIMQNNGQPSCVPSPSVSYEKLPDDLKKYAFPYSTNK